MRSVRLERLTFAHADAVPLASDLDLRLDPRRTGLVGANGAGKTTLLRSSRASYVRPPGASASSPPAPRSRSSGRSWRAGRGDGSARAPRREPGSSTGCGPTVERLEEALRAYPGALLLVTHDDAFAAACTHARWRVAESRVDTAG